MSSLFTAKTGQLFEAYLAQHYITRILRPYRRAKSFRILVIVPAGSKAAHWVDHATAVMIEFFPRSSNKRADWDVNAVGDKDVFQDCTSALPRLLVLVDAKDQDLIDETLRAGMDEVVAIGEVSAEIVQRVAKLRLGQTIDLSTASTLARLPVGTRNYFLRRGADVAKAVCKLSGAVAGLSTTREIPKPSNPRLADLAGYGDAKDWGLQLAQDLKDYRSGTITWDDVDRGVLLSGPPGCGKTTFAKVLAETCDVHFEVGSYASWFGKDGGQGGLIRKMRESFAQAAKNAPSILFIDEIDSFGDRDAQPDWHAEWSRQVVNALLECIDGAGSRVGVVVVGACNNSAVIDPAIRRAGRLDRHIEIPLPDASARDSILRWHLQCDIDVTEAVGRTDGMSGADLERLARDARRVARRQRREVSFTDLLSALPERRPYSVENLQACAIHEAGHAVVGVVLNIRYAEQCEY